MNNIHSSTKPGKTIAVRKETSNVVHIIVVLLAGIHMIYSAIAPGMALPPTSMWSCGKAEFRWALMII